MSCTLNCNFSSFWGKDWKIISLPPFASSLTHSWIIYTHYFLSHTNLSPPLFLCGFCIHAVCLCVLVNLHVCVCVCVCGVCWCVLCVLLFVFLVFSSCSDSNTHSRQRFSSQAAQSCRDPSVRPLVPRDSNRSSVTNGSDLIHFIASTCNK